MKTYFNLIESIQALLESRVDQLKQQNPHLADSIEQYSNIDPTPTKKFVPWLVSQHKKGNVTPDDPDVSNVIQNFDRYKRQHGITDHSARSYGEVRNAVLPHIGSAATKKEQKKQEELAGTEKLHDANDIKAFHIKTKEASQNLYGGGEARGGEEGGARGTTWCVSARSDACLFNKVYGPMYTIHNPNDSRAPYAVHPQEDKITSRFNDGDKPIKDVLKNKPELKPAVDKIQKHYEEQKSERDNLIKMLKSPNATKEHLDKALNDEVYRVRKAAANHPNATEEHLNKALNDDHPDVREAATKHPNATKEHLDKALNDEVYRVRKAAANHPNATKEHLNKALDDVDSDVREAATKHPNATKEHLDKALNDDHPYVREAAASHPNATKEHLNKALNDDHSYVRKAAANHPNATKEHLDKALNDEVYRVRKAAANHPNATEEHLNKALNDDHPDVRAAASNILAKRQ